MRGALFVVVVAAHIIMILLFPTLRRLVLPDKEGEEPPNIPVFLPPLPQRRQTVASRGNSSLSSRAEPTRRRQSAGSQQIEREPQPQPEEETTPTGPDWRMQAGQAAQSIAQRLVEAEDAAKRRADALTSRFKPLPPPRVRGPEFGWDYAATHRIVPLEGGGFAISINDNCQLAVLPMPFFGCVIGKIKANGDLFKYMHPPMKYGDWDKRDTDP